MREGFPLKSFLPGIVLPGEKRTNLLKFGGGRGNSMMQCPKENIFKESCFERGYDLKILMLT